MLHLTVSHLSSEKTDVIILYDRCHVNWMQCNAKFEDETIEKGEPRNIAQGYRVWVCKGGYCLAAAKGSLEGSRKQG